MKQIFLALIMCFIANIAWSQTQSTLPTGSVPYGQIYIHKPSGDIWGGLPSGKYKKLALKAYVDSLLALIGPGGGTLQSITNGVGNNKTTNALIVSGYNNFDLSTDGVQVLSTGTGESSLWFTKGGRIEGEISLNPTQLGFFHRPTDESTSGLYFEAETPISAGAHFLTRVSGYGAKNLTEFVNLEQLQDSLSSITPPDVSGKADKAGGNNFTGPQTFTGTFLQKENTTLGRIRTEGGSSSATMTASNGTRSYVSMFKNAGEQGYIGYDNADGGSFTAKTSGTEMRFDMNSGASYGTYSFHLNGNQIAAINGDGSMTGANAINNDEFVTLGQLKDSIASSIPPGIPGTVTNVSSANANITITNPTTTPQLTLASTITSNTSGNAATSSSSVTSTLWNGYANSFTNPTTSLSTTGFILGVSNASTTVQKFGQTAIRDFLGLGSNAYTSTSFLPLSGGTLTGALGGTTSNFSTSVTSPSFIGTLNGGMTVADPLLGGTVSFKFDPDFNSWRLTSTLIAADNRNIYTDGYIRADEFVGRGVNVTGAVIGQALTINSSQTPGYNVAIGGAMKITKVVADTLNATLGNFTGVVKVATPIATGDAATKGYADGLAAGKANIASPTFTTKITTPAITVSSAPTSTFPLSGQILVRDGTTGDVKGMGLSVVSPVAGNYLYYNGSNFVNASLPWATASATLDFPNVMMNQNATLTVTVTGAAIGNMVTLGLPNSILSTMTAYNGAFQAWVSATNTVSIRFQNSDPMAPHDLPSGTFYVKVFFN